ncbi:Flagellar L-ring protein [Sulfidibacter corallicola]|uniref:Flagellar L-ring protein n=1 Tax=Sulfidibacter corallicola TaxID=2818388 RepID=A0A8A4TXN8_SULCO|nr:flagellar basal body L-ring protein FlgH [Sulfidibacter corallicola]QTD53864.1 flagellar basal body L-ring protein FlgH [Sulfidibacter corallicola]
MITSRPNTFITWGIVLLGTFMTTGCMRHHGLLDGPPPTIEPFEIDETPSPQIYAPGSLFTDQNIASGMISDTKAFRLNDIILIRIAESFNATTNARTATTRENEASLKIPNLLGLEKTHTQFFGEGTTDGTLVGATSDSSHTGDGSTQRSETFTGSVAGRVIRVLPNGYLVVQGQKHLRVNGEQVQFYLSGIVNPLLVEKDNSITSSQIADLNVYYHGRGVVSGLQNPGFFSRVLHAIWPF